MIRDCILRTFIYDQEHTRQDLSLRRDDLVYALLWRKGVFFYIMRY